jgi:hypothetical protein
MISDYAYYLKLLYHGQFPCYCILNMFYQQDMIRLKYFKFYCIRHQKSFYFSYVCVYTYIKHINEPFIQIIFQVFHIFKKNILKEKYMWQFICKFEKMNEFIEIHRKLMNSYKEFEFHFYHIHDIVIWEV